MIAMRPYFVGFGFLVLGICTARTETRTQDGALWLPHVFGDHMVLQAERPVPVWGGAPAGAQVTVQFAGQRKFAIAAEDGRWRVTLDPMPATGATDVLHVSATGPRAGAGRQPARSIRDVLVGEVWLCSGQSNMEKPLGGPRGVFNAEAEIRNAGFPLIRLLKVKKTRRLVPGEDVEAAWEVCSPASLDALKFSAAGYFFGRKLHTELHKPVGLIDASWGGSRIESWTAPTAFEAAGSLEEFSAAVRKPGAAARGTVPSTLYYGMISPLVPYAMRGVIWYQGESNIILNDGAWYLHKMTALVQGWRLAWGTELPFYYVQIAPHLYHVLRPLNIVSPEAAPRLWEAQAEAMHRLPRTGMITTTDLVDDLFDIHPRNKRDVGERLARWALAKDYGRGDLEFSGPVFKGMVIQGDRAILSFDHVGGGLMSRDRKPLTWFSVAGPDGEFHPGLAQIHEDTVVVRSGNVSHPKVVRFAWDEAAQPNLVNRAGLPAVPFRSDNPLHAATSGSPIPAGTGARKR